MIVGIFRTPMLLMRQFGRVMEIFLLILPVICQVELKLVIDEIVEKNNVRCVRLNDLLNEEIDFLKIDIEGAELPVLKDCSDNLKNVKNLFVEYHGKYDEMFKLNEILEILVAK